MSTTPKELAAARFIAVTKRPYLALALFALTPIERRGLKTMAVDKKYRLYYDPIIFHHWNREQIAAVLIHEVSHVLRKHHLRCEKLQANADLWNKATDAEINDDLLAEGLDLPGSPVIPTALGLSNGRLAEEYYLLLKQQQEQSQQQQQNQQQQQSQQSQQQQSNLQPQDSDSTGDIEEFPAPGSGRCGSCATGIREDYEADEKEAPGLSHIEQLALEERVAKQILKASQGRGKVAGSWARWANKKLTPKADWRKELSSLINASLRMTSGANDYSYSRPNRRQSVYGNIVMPSLVQYVPNIAVIVDTSGSFSDRMMSQALVEVQNILKRTGQKLQVLSCDARVHFNKKVSNIKEVKLVGGGGTDMRVGIREALEIKPKPDVIIVITDGDTPWPTQSPKRTKVVAALTRPKRVPSWIKKVELFD